jgi:hypothetical protein
MSPTVVRARTSTVSADGPGAAGADPDLEITRRGLEYDRAAHDLAHPDIPVRGLRDDVGARPVDGDAAVGRAEPRTAAGQTDPRVAVGILDHRAAVELTQAQLT